MGSTDGTETQKDLPHLGTVRSSVWSGERLQGRRDERVKAKVLEQNAVA